MVTRLKEHSMQFDDFEYPLMASVIGTAQGLGCGFPPSVFQADAQSP